MKRGRTTIKLLLCLIILFGLCLPVFAQETKLELNYPAFGGESIGESPTLTQYIRYIFIFAISIAGFLLIMVLVIGGVQYIYSGTDVGKLRMARQKIISSSFGILLLLSSYIILYTINPNLTNLNEPTIAQLATVPLPETPISSVPTADLLARIKILAEDTKEIPDIIYNSARLIEDITNQCDCDKTKPMCSCQEVLTCPDNSWYTIYGHMDRIDIKEGDEIVKGQLIGEVGEVATDISPNLFFGLGFKTGEDIFLIDITSKISAPGGITGSSGDKEPLPEEIKTKDIDYVLKTLSNPLEYSQCVWYEIKNSSVNTGKNYWGQSWRCQSEPLSDSAKVHAISGGDEYVKNLESKFKEGKIESIVEKIDKEKGEIVIKHECIKPTPTPSIPEPSVTPIEPDNGSSPGDTQNPVTPSSFLKTKSLASIESLADITCQPLETHYFYDNFQSEGCCRGAVYGPAGNQFCCPFGQTHYFYNNFQSEACCNTYSGAGSVCGPAGEQKCCLSANSETCVNTDSGALCCKNEYKCGWSFTDENNQACCNAETPYCTSVFFNNLAYQKWFCTTPEKTKACYDDKDRTNPVVFCKQTDNCVNGKDGFSCSNSADSIVCGDPGHQISCTDLDGNIEKDKGDTNVTCGGTGTEPACVTKNIFKCQEAETKCGDEEGYQTCCISGETCKTRDYLENNIYHKMGHCCPNEEPNLCYEPNSNEPPVCCGNNDACIKTKEGFGCCDKTTSKVFGATGFQICCTDPDGNPAPGAGPTDVIDIGTWNNLQCLTVDNNPPINCIPETTACGNIVGYQACCNLDFQNCITRRDPYDNIDKGYCCLKDEPYLCAIASGNKPPVCCGGTCTTSTKNENLCCGGPTPQVCSYYIWGFYVGSSCCSDDSFCSGTWSNPTCTAEIPIEEPPVEPGCERFYISQIRGRFPTAQYVDICCGETESACFNYKDPESKLCCPSDQLCVNNQSGANCSCPKDGYKVCGDPKLSNQVCCRTDQFCGGTAEQAACIDPIVSPTPPPSDISCNKDAGEKVCKSANPDNLIPDLYYTYRSETQVCCAYGDACYLKNKSGNPIHPSEYFLYRTIVPNSTGACCPSDKNLWFPEGEYYFNGYGVCCDKDVDIAIDKNGIGTCCNSGEKACGPEDASNPSVHYGVCCPSDQKCVNNQCQKIPTYCESPAPSPVNEEYPAACPCSPSPSPTPETSPQALKCAEQTCFGEDKYHPCGEIGGKELLFWQNEIISKDDILIYYRNRLIAERKDLEVDLEQFIKPTMIWFNKEIQRHYQQLSDKSIPTWLTEQQIEFLKERMGWMEEEQKYKEDLLNKMKEAEKLFADFEVTTKNISRLPDRCQSNVPQACTSVCTKEGQIPESGKFAGENGEDLLFSGNGTQLGNYGCHNAFFGCKPVACKGGNPCPKEEINEQTNELEEQKEKMKSAYDEIIYIILNIKKERIPKITL